MNINNLTKLVKRFVILITLCLLFNSSYAQGSVKTEDDTIKNQLPVLERYEVRITVCTNFNDVIKITDPDDSVFQVSCIKKPDFVNFAWNGCDSITFYGHFWGAEEYETEIKLQVTDFKDTIDYDLIISYTIPTIEIDKYADTCYVGEDYKSIFGAISRYYLPIKVTGFPSFLTVKDDEGWGTLSTKVEGVPQKADIGTHVIYYEYVGCKAIQNNTFLTVMEKKDTISNIVPIFLNSKYISIYNNILLLNNNGIHKNTAKPIDYEIYNILGLKVLNGSTNMTINIDCLSSGVYILKTSLFTTKFAKQ